MKKSLLLLLLPVLLFTSCSKDSDTKAETTEGKLKGTWKETYSKYEYFDKSGSKIYEKDVPLRTIVFDGASTVVATYGSDAMTADYIVSKEKSGEYLSITNGVDFQKYTIESISNTNLSLSLEMLNAVYYVGSTKKTAAKSILNTSLVKQ